MNRNNKNYKEGGNDEVEEMLREAEDAVLLKLSVNSHMAHNPASDLPPDLAQRFRCLKSGSSTSKAPQKSTNTSTVVAKMGGEQSSVPVGNDGDDLFARFAALKASLPKPSSAASSSSMVDPLKGEIKRSSDGGSNDDHEDEVDKIIRWAVDAARLDPSPESDDDDIEDDKNVSDSDSGSGDEDDDDDQKKKNRKGICKK